MVNICRFCLSEDENYLIPVQDVLDFELTIEDLVRFTGIQVTVALRAPTLNVGIGEDLNKLHCLCSSTMNTKHPVWCV